jgi:hypothetical protein
MSADNSDLPDHDAAWWENYRARIERAARMARSRAGAAIVPLLLAFLLGIVGAGVASQVMVAVNC